VSPCSFPVVGGHLPEKENRSEAIIKDGTGKHFSGPVISIGSGSDRHTGLITDLSRFRTFIANGCRAAFVQIRYQIGYIQNIEDTITVGIALDKARWRRAALV